METRTTDQPTRSRSRLRRRGKLAVIPAAVAAAAVLVAGCTGGVFSGRNNTGVLAGVYAWTRNCNGYVYAHATATSYGHVQKSQALTCGGGTSAGWVLVGYAVPGADVTVVFDAGAYNNQVRIGSQYL